MTWRSAKGNWHELQVPFNEVSFVKLVEGMTGSDAPTGPMSIVMASIIRYEGLQRVVELGVWKGGTTVFLADACRDTGGTCWCIDKDDCPEARERLTNLGLAAPYCYFRHGDTLTVELIPDIDLLFIDAGHQYHEFKRDWERWAPQVKPGGWVFIDNTMSEAGVMRYMADLVIRKDFQRDWQYLNSEKSFGMAILRKRTAPDAEVYQRRLKR